MNAYQPTRRHLLLGAMVAGLSSTFPVRRALAENLKVAMLIPGPVDDGGFMQAGYEGLLAIEKELGAEISYVDRLEPKMELLTAAIRELAQAKPDLIVSHGGQTAEAMTAVAPEFPDIKFSVNQGNVTGPNLASYEILQEESAWLAGAAAGLLTETGVVSHISAHRVRPGLNGRAAFYNGLRTTNPDAKFLTTFIEKQDDAALAKATAKAQIEAGSDIIFTMLSGEIIGVTEACEEAGIHQIGNVREWHTVNPVFIASAVANVSIAPLRAARDVASGAWQGERIVKIGLQDSDAVRLATAPSVPAEVTQRIDELAHKIKSGEIEVSTEYTGEEFPIPKD